MRKKAQARTKKRQSKKPAIKDLTPLQAKYLALRAVGFPPQQAYLHAGGSPKAISSEPYNLEKRIKEFGICRDDLLEDGSKAIKKILSDYLNNDERAHVPAVSRVIQMQQDRINPAVQKTESKHLHLHVVSPEIIAEVDRDFEVIMKDADKWTRKQPQIAADSETA